MPFCEEHGFYKLECSSCLHEIHKAGKQMDKEMAKYKKLKEKAKLKAQEPKPAVKKVSVKQKEKNTEYGTRVKEWKMGKMCVVFPSLPATTNHHAKGRIGYADQWARDRGITLLMDERYWIPASLEGHRWIEEHPQEAKDRGWSQSRLENLDQEIKTI